MNDINTSIEQVKADYVASSIRSDAACSLMLNQLAALKQPHVKAVHLFAKFLVKNPVVACRSVGGMQGHCAAISAIEYFESVLGIHQNHKLTYARLQGYVRQVPAMLNQSQYQVQLECLQEIEAIMKSCAPW